jgi:hypothetical protein
MSSPFTNYFESDDTEHNPRCNVHENDEATCNCEELKKEAFEDYHHNLTSD